MCRFVACVVFAVRLVCGRAEAHRQGQVGPRVSVRLLGIRLLFGRCAPRRRSNQPRLSASRASGRREGSGEASVAVHVGRLMSIERTIVRSAEVFRTAEGNTGGLVMVRGRRAPRCQRTHARMKSSRRDLGDLHPALVFVPGPHRKGERNLSTTLRHRRLRFTEQSLLLWMWQVG